MKYDGVNSQKMLFCYCWFWYFSYCLLLFTFYPLVLICWLLLLSGVSIFDEDILQLVGQQWILASGTDPVQRSRWFLVSDGSQLLVQITMAPESTMDLDFWYRSRRFLGQQSMFLVQIFVVPTSGTDLGGSWVSHVSRLLVQILMVPGSITSLMTFLLLFQIILLQSFFISQT
jgi:hypothetical protein